MTKATFDKTQKLAAMQSAYKSASKDFIAREAAIKEVVTPRSDAGMILTRKVK